MAQKNWGLAFDRAKLAEFRRFTQEAIKASSGDEASTLKETARGVVTGFQRASVLVRDAARGFAAAAGVPRRLYSGQKPAIFAFSDFEAAKGTRRRNSALIGVRTGLSSRAPDQHLYVRWGKGGKRRKGGSIAMGGLSMSLGALFERGRADKRIAPARYFRNAIQSTRSAVVQILTSSYQKAFLKLNGK